MRKAKITTSASLSQLLDYSLAGFRERRGVAFKGIDTRSNCPELKSLPIDAAALPLYMIIYPAFWLYHISGYSFGDNKRGLNKFKKKYHDKMAKWIIENKISDIHLGLSF